jgi:lysine-N-methylase
MTYSPAPLQRHPTQERNLPRTPLIHPAYAERFRCIGPACEDTCCQGWAVPVELVAIEKFQTLPYGPLRKLIDVNILVTPSGEENSKPATFAAMRMNTSNQCSMLTEERLCRIQAQLGESFLPHSCATYPRIVNSIAGVEDKSLALSCPEAARLVLLNPHLLNTSHPRPSRSRFGARIEATQVPPANTLSPHSEFWPIRESVLALIRNRAYPLWQRLFLLGNFCRQMDGIAKGELHCSISEFLRDFETSVASGTARKTMNTLPLNRLQQLDFVLRLAGLLLQTSVVHQRFSECVQSFTGGIGNGPHATLGSLTANYTVAHDHYYAPFFERHPYILENYLINAIFRYEFPFGRGVMQSGAAPSMAHEHVRLITQFVLIKGLLIGVAGFHGEAFSAGHIVHTVQATSKHFEHCSEFPDRSYALLVERHLGSELGIAALLRNTEPAQKRRSATA